MRTLITFAKLSACPILALACLLLVGGCEKKQEVVPDSYFTELVTVRRGELNRCEVVEVILKIDEDMPVPGPYRLVPVDDPYPPCPDTVYKYASPSVLVQMPPGRWVTSRFICNWCEMSEHLETWPDSVFILKEKE